MEQAEKEMGLLVVVVVVAVAVCWWRCDVFVVVELFSICVAAILEQRK